MYALKLVGCMQAPAGGAANQLDSNVAATHAMVAYLQTQVDNLACQNWQMEQQLAQNDADMLRRHRQAEPVYLRFWEMSGQVCTTSRSTTAALAQHIWSMATWSSSPYMCTAP